MDYQDKSKIWDKFATIRSRPRRIVKETEIDQDCFPRNRQPLCSHPLILSQGKDCIKYILIQTLNRFMHEIAILETEMVNHGALIVANNKLLPYCDFPDALRYDALSVIIDEAYHAYVAIDFLNQIAKLNKVALLPVAKEVAVINAVSVVKSHLPDHLHKIFELIAVCIGEHVLTKELININKEENTCQSFQAVMADHVYDEGRHANMFSYVLKYLWANLSKEDKNLIGPEFPNFLKEYLKQDIQKQYDKKMLMSLHISEDEVESIISDTYIEYCETGINGNNPIVVNLLMLLQRCDIMDHEKTAQAFEKYQLVCA